LGARLLARQLTTANARYMTLFREERESPVAKRFSQCSALRTAAAHRATPERR
jgi:hypothetical protein